MKNGKNSSFFHLFILIYITWETRSTVRTLRHRLTERRCWKIPIDKIVVDKRDKTLKMFHKTLEIKHNYILRARQTHKTEIHATLLVCLCLLQSEGWETLLSNIFCVQTSQLTVHRFFVTFLFLIQFKRWNDLILFFVKKVNSAKICLKYVFFFILHWWNACILYQRTEKCDHKINSEFDESIH